MKAIGICFFFLLGLILTMDSQSIYVSTGSGQGLKKVNLTTEGCKSDTIIGCSDQNYFAIARFGTIMYFTNNTLLYQASISHDTISDCRVVDFTPVAMTSLTVDNTGIIYSTNSNALYKWDPLSGNGFELLGTMPFVAAGDLVFFQNELYMASLSGIVKVNINSPSLSTMHIPMSSQSVYGLAALSVDCNQNKVYAFESINAGTATRMIELDLTNRQIVGVACQLPYGVADAASEVEGGIFSGISLLEIEVLPQCKVPGKGSIRITREPGLAIYSYTLNGSITNTTGLFWHLDPGSYYIEINTPGGCYLDTLVNVPLFNTVVPEIQEHIINADCTGPGKLWFTINPDAGGNKVIYDNRDTVPASYQFTNLTEGLHHFSIVDKYFCELGAKDIIISIEGSCDTVYFPSAFTPNNDGKNDTFRGSGNRSVQDYKLSVYNRWGELVFYTTNILSGWDGKKNYVEQNPGVYVWVATYSSKDGVPKKRKGTVVLLR